MSWVRWSPRLVTIRPCRALAACRPANARIKEKGRTVLAEKRVCYLECLTLGEAVVALDHLPEPRQSAATIKIGGRVFTASEIDQPHHANNKKAGAPRLRQHAYA